jgi:hypothetical protein
MKLSRLDTICFIIAILLLAFSLRGHSCENPILTGNERGNQYTYTTGLTCTTAGGVKALAGQAIIHVDGEIVGGGQGYYDLRALDGYVLRVVWPFEWKLDRCQRLTIVGSLERAGRVVAMGYVPKAGI